MWSSPHNASPRGSTAAKPMAYFRVAVLPLSNGCLYSTGCAKCYHTELSNTIFFYQIAGVPGNDA